MAVYSDGTEVILPPNRLKEPLGGWGRGQAPKSLSPKILFFRAFCPGSLQQSWWTCEQLAGFFLSLDFRL